jgi:uncharacterized protein (DUF2236 family)
MTIETVSREDLEEQLATVRALAPRGAEGVFGPASVTWQIDREAAIFLGAGRALLLQLAHPWVAAAIFEHSRTFTDPIGRFHRTFEVVFSLVFGALDQAFAAARRLHRRHCVRINDNWRWSFAGKRGLYNCRFPVPMYPRPMAGVSHYAKLCRV